MDQLNLIIPELFLSVSIMILLMIGVFYKNSFKFNTDFRARFNRHKI